MTKKLIQPDTLDRDYQPNRLNGAAKGNIIPTPLEVNFKFQFLSIKNKIFIIILKRMWTVLNKLEEKYNIY